MFIEHQSKIIFIHIPKCGGTSINYALGGYDNGFIGIAHAGPDVAKNYIFQDDWELFTSFTIVRNPWDRYVSLYLYQKSKKYGELTDFNYSYRLASSLTLEEWASHNIHHENKSKWFGIPQTHWWRGVSNVFKFEEMNCVEIFLSNILNRKIILRARNMSTEKRPKIPQKFIDYIAELERETIDTLNYSVPDLYVI